MTTYGLTPQGFRIKTFQEIRKELVQDYKNTFGQTLDVTENSYLGKRISLDADRLSVLWELQQAVYASLDPQKSEGQQLDFLSGLTGTFRNKASRSYVDQVLMGSPGAIIPYGTSLSSDTSAIFQTKAPRTLTQVAARLSNNPIVKGQRRTSGGNIYLCIVSGVTGNTSITSQGAVIADGSASWKYEGSGTARGVVRVSSKDTGPVQAFAGQINTIQTTVSGLSSTFNPLDVTLGKLEESDGALRVRRRKELASNGDTTKGAVEARLSAVPYITSLGLLWNDTSETNSSGQPGHSLEVLVEGGDDQEIRDTILASISGQTGTFGNVSGTAKTPLGSEHAVHFSRPEIKDIYLKIYLTFDKARYISDDHVKASVVSVGKTLPTGKDVNVSGIIAACYDSPGILDVTGVLLGASSGPFETLPIAIDLRQRASFDTSRIVIVSVEGVP